MNWSNFFSFLFSIVVVKKTQKSLSPWSWSIKPTTTTKKNDLSKNNDTLKWITLEKLKKNGMDEKINNNKNIQSINSVDVFIWESFFLYFINWIEKNTDDDDDCNSVRQNNKTDKTQ